MEFEEAIANAVRTGSVLYHSHAQQRMFELGLDLYDIEHVLRQGARDCASDTWSPDFSSWKRAMQGLTMDGMKIRVMVVIEDPSILVVTAMNVWK